MNKLQKTSNLQVPIYLDYQATTPMDPRVLDAMLPYMSEKYGNPHSTSHDTGRKVSIAVEQARSKIANLIGAQPGNIIFTSGATESNNLAIKGVALNRKNTKRHIITTSIEHKVILETCKYLQTYENFEVTYLPVQTNGLVDLKILNQSLRKDTLLCSVIFVQNEIGVIQNITEIGSLCRAKGVLFHTDAAQACGKVDIDVDKMNIDLLSLTGHKFFGPKGIGALYVRESVIIDPIFNGGGQEKGIRSGTLPSHVILLNLAVYWTRQGLRNSQRGGAIRLRLY